MFNFFPQFSFNPFKQVKDICQISLTNFKALLPLALFNMANATTYRNYTFRDDHDLNYIISLNTHPEYDQCYSFFKISSLLESIVEQLPNCNASQISETVYNSSQELLSLVEKFFPYEVWERGFQPNGLGGTVTTCTSTDKTEYYALFFKDALEGMNVEFNKCVSELINDIYIDAFKNQISLENGFWKTLGIVIGATAGTIGLYCLSCILYAIISERKERNRDLSSQNSSQTKDLIHHEAIELEILESDNNNEQTTQVPLLLPSKP